LAKELVKLSYSITRKLPEIEKYALVQQMNRAAISVPSNIAEGMSRFSSKEKIHFINIAYGSMMELVCQTEIAHELCYIEKSDSDRLSSEAKMLAVKLSNLAAALRK
jgi:four helix bundle protein